MPPALRRGALITLEGGEGSGKSTQAEALCRRLTAEGYSVTVAREPDGTDLGRLVKGVFERAAGEPKGLLVAPVAELLLFEAARAQHLVQVIRPALDRSDIVLCDRFIDSTLAYQGYGRGLSLADVRAANCIATGALMPDLTLLFDLPAEEGLARKRREAIRDSIGQEPLEFHKRVRQGYLELARQEPERIVVLDGSLPLEEVTRNAWRSVQRLLARLS